MDPDTPPTDLPGRRHVFDDDAFDTLSILAQHLHIGQRDTTLAPPTASNKAAILAALATFDSDSDERDDTYDADDVGGTVDTSVPSIDDRHETERNDEVLFIAWKTSPGVFHRDVATRRSNARATLRHQTGMTDEAIEGWGLMLSRDERKVKYLEVANLTTFTGTQRQLPSNSWRAGEVKDEGEENEDNLAAGSLRGERRDRLGARMAVDRAGVTVHVGDVAGLASERSTQVARQRKNLQKGPRANHNRRNQRSKKMARAGVPG